MEAPAVGLMVTRSITLVRHLASGGMGSVWIADHASLKCEVVVKLMSTLLAADPGYVERFSREAASAARVSSPHVVRCFDHGVTESGIPFIVMEYLQGEDLNTALTTRGTLPLDEVAEIVRQLARALSRAHALGIVHRDIKPRNIFLCTEADGSVFVKVLDFGVAKVGGPTSSGESTQTGALVGTATYASPEQLMGLRGVDHRSDLWSVGLVVFRALTGERAFRAETVGALAVEINKNPLPLPSSVKADLPASIDRWFERACAIEPNARYQSAQELADALLDVARGLEPGTGPRAAASNPLLPVPPPSHPSGPSLPGSSSQPSGKSEPAPLASTVGEKDQGTAASSVFARVSREASLHSRSRRAMWFAFAGVAVFAAVLGYAAIAALRPGAAASPSIAPASRPPLASSPALTSSADASLVAPASGSAPMASSATTRHDKVPRGATTASATSKPYDGIF